MKKLSVIIPLYNCEQFICHAIESVLCQTGVDIEIIIVNDDSTDNSLDVISRYNDLIKVLTTKHSGASACRNIGIKAATGDYIMFLDADDFLNDSTICQRTINVMETNVVDMGMFSFTYYYNCNGQYSSMKPYSHKSQVITDANELVKELVKEGTFFASPCFKIINKDFLIKNQLFFIEGTTAEDVEWFVNLLCHLKSFCVINDFSYIYRKNTLSSVTGSFTQEKCENHLNMIKAAIQDIQYLKDGEKKTALLSAMAYQYCILLSNSYDFRDEAKLIKSIKSLSWILSYNVYPGVRTIHLAHRLFGYNITSFLLNKYKSHCAGSLKHMNSKKL